VLGPWKNSLPAGADAGWKHAERAAADFDNDGQLEMAVLTSDASIDGRNRPIWEDGHRWRFYFEEVDGSRTYAFERFVPNGRIDAMIPEALGDRRVVTLVVRSPSQFATYEIEYGGPDRTRTRTIYERTIEKPLSPPVR
jgi:hypothetical protein